MSFQVQTRFSLSIETTPGQIFLGMTLGIPNKKHSFAEGGVHKFEKPRYLAEVWYVKKQKNIEYKFTLATARSGRGDGALIGMIGDLYRFSTESVEPTGSMGCTHPTYIKVFHRKCS